MQRPPPSEHTCYHAHVPVRQPLAVDRRMWCQRALCRRRRGGTTRPRRSRCATTTEDALADTWRRCARDHPVGRPAIGARNHGDDAGSTAVPFPALYPGRISSAAGTGSRRAGRVLVRGALGPGPGDASCAGRSSIGRVGSPCWTLPVATPNDGNAGHPHNSGAAGWFVAPRRAVAYSGCSRTATRGLPTGLLAGSSPTAARWCTPVFERFADVDAGDRR